MKSRFMAVGALLAATVALSACGGSDDDAVWAATVDALMGARR